MLSLVFLAYPIAMILADPDWARGRQGHVIPHFVASREFLLVAVALVGTTITPYMQLYQAAAVADRGIGPDEYKHERIDAVVGSLFAGFIFVSILIATARPSDGTGHAITSADQAAKALEPVAGAGAEALFAIGLLGASMLAAAVVPLSTAYGLAEAVGVERSVSRRFREAPLFLGPVRGADPDRRRRRADPGEPDRPADRHAGPERVHHPDHPRSSCCILTNRPSAVGAAVNGPRFKVFALISVVVVSILALAAFGVTVASALGF